MRRLLGITTVTNFRRCEPAKQREEERQIKCKNDTPEASPLPVFL